MARWVQYWRAQSVAFILLFLLLFATFSPFLTNKFMGQENQKDPFAPQELTSAEDVGLLMEGDVVRVRKFGMEVRVVVGSGSTDEKKVLLWRGAMGTVFRACVPVRSAFVSNGVLNLETLFGVESYNKMSGTGDAFKNHNEISDELNRLGFKEAGGCY